MALVAAKPSFVVRNISNKTVNAAGLRLKPGKTADLFDAIVGLTESTVITLMSKPKGSLYLKLKNKELKFIGSSLVGVVDTDLLDAKISDVRVSLEDVTAQATDTMSQAEYARGMMRGPIRQSVNTLEDAIIDLQNCLGAAMSGDITMSLSVGRTTLSAVALNSADAGTVTVACTAELHYGADEKRHVWATFTPAFTASKGTVASSGVLAPVLSEVEFIGGLARFTATISTGSGKVYVPGEALSINARVNSVDLLGSITVEPVTVEIDII
jgi:hypothetical protein